jgi:hypothetical protein
MNVDLNCLNDVQATQPHSSDPEAEEKDESRNTDGDSAQDLIEEHVNWNEKAKKGPNVTLRRSVPQFDHKLRNKLKSMVGKVCCTK